MHELQHANHRLSSEIADCKDLLRRREMQLAQQQLLTSQLSRQLRSPLSSIIGTGSLLRDTLPDEAARQHLETILTAADSMLGILADLPLYRHHDAETYPLPCNLKALAPQLEGFFAGAAYRKQIGFEIRWDAGMPESLYCDLPRLRQILLVLVHNAVRFTVEGQVCLEAKTRSICDHEAEIRFDVTDTGMGMSAQRIQRLLAPRPPAAAKGFGRGGHSLMAAMEWLRLMESRLEIESTEGKGSRFGFTLVLPMHQAGDIAVEKQPGAIPAHWRHAQVLVVDDEPTNRELLASMVGRLGVARVDMADDGAEAVNRSADRAYDLILMDCQMPRMDGFAASRAIRRMARHAHSPFIIGITADVMRADTAKCYAAGMDDYYHKPLTFIQLQQLFHKWLTERLTSESAVL